MSRSVPAQERADAASLETEATAAPLSGPPHLDLASMPLTNMSFEDYLPHDSRIQGPIRPVRRIRRSGDGAPWAFNSSVSQYPVPSPRPRVSQSSPIEYQQDPRPRIQSRFNRASEMSSQAGLGPNLSQASSIPQSFVQHGNRPLIPTSEHLHPLYPTHPISSASVTSDVSDIHSRVESSRQSITQSYQQSYPSYTKVARDALLAYANGVYAASSPRSMIHLTSLTSRPDGPATPKRLHQRELLSLLTSLRDQFPNHLPTLLLLSCAHYDVSEFQTCIEYCADILNMDPTSVEAMTNMGTALMAIGKSDEAEHWWMKAIRLRPTCWSAIEELLSVLCGRNPKTTSGPRYSMALQLCDFVLSNINTAGGHLLVTILPSELPRLQNILLTCANLRYITTRDSRASWSDYSRSIELVTKPIGNQNPDLKHGAQALLLASISLGLLVSLPSSSSAAAELAALLKLDPSFYSVGVFNPAIDWLEATRRVGPSLVELFMRWGGGVLPFVFLTPEEALRIPTMMFGGTRGVLPAFSDQNTTWDIVSTVESDMRAKRILSTIFLTVAKVYLGNSAQAPSRFLGTSPPIPVSRSLILALYYLALSLNPTASLYNNIGIILAHIPEAAISEILPDQRRFSESVPLAKRYFLRGLDLNPEHPQLLTNLGSMMRDQGQVIDAVRLYQRVLQIKPDFEVALVNIANTVYDNVGHLESIDYYRRAFIVNPDLPEAVSGMVNALSSVCDWGGGRGSIGVEPIIDSNLQYIERKGQDRQPRGWMGKMETITHDQLEQGYTFSSGILQATGRDVNHWIVTIEEATGKPLTRYQRSRWQTALNRMFSDSDRRRMKLNECGFLIRLAERLGQVLQQRWFLEAFGGLVMTSTPMKRIPASYPPNWEDYRRVTISPILDTPPTPTILPFHTCAYSMSARTTRLVAHRHGLLISHKTLTAPWLPKHILPPPPPPSKRLRIGYVSYNFNDHPLSHLMLSVFRLHDRRMFSIFLYALSASDKSRYRETLEHDADHFLDVSAWSTQDIVHQILRDEIHILVNLGAHTKGSRNEVFAARPSPLQLSFMGYAGTLAAGWCDYLVCDQVSCPPESFAPFRAALRKAKGSPASSLQDLFMGEAPAVDEESDIADPEATSEDWMYTEKFLYLPHTYFVTDHRQSYTFREQHIGLSDERRWDLEQQHRTRMRREILADVPEDAVVFACFSQLYKICPSTFAAWLKVLSRVPNSYLWLLRFPAAGEPHLLQTARLWAGDAVASRIRFTDVVRKELHIARGRVADLFLDTFQCCAHTVAADVLWAGTPILTLPKDPMKMCTRVGASIATATGFGPQMVVTSAAEYEGRAVALGLGNTYKRHYYESGDYDMRGTGELMDLRRSLFLLRDQMPLFDTPRYVSNLEKGLLEAWRRWVQSCGTLGLNEPDGGCIIVKDDRPFFS